MFAKYHANLLVKLWLWLWQMKLQGIFKIWSIDKRQKVKRKQNLKDQHENLCKIPHIGIHPHSKHLHSRGLVEVEGFQVNEVVEVIRVVSGVLDDLIWVRGCRVVEVVAEVNDSICTMELAR